MKRMKHYLIVPLLAVISFGAMAQNEGTIDKVIAVVGNEMIMLSDLEQEIAMARFGGVISEANLRCEILENLLLQKLLLAQARIDSLTVNEADVEAAINDRIRSMIMNLGSEKAVEKYFRKPLFKIKEDARNVLMEQDLTRQMRGHLIAGVAVTPAEVEIFYKKMPKDSLPIIPDQYSIRQIVLDPPEGSAKFEVRERLLGLRERILNGEKFSTLAIMYSEDGSAKRGGEYGLSPADQYATAFRNALIILKPGQVSPIVETEYGLHIIQLIEKQGNDMVNFRHILMKPKYSAEDKSKALMRLDSVAGLIRADSISFANAAMRFSEDKDTRLNGGLVVNPYSYSSRFEKDQLNGQDYAALQNMKEGDVSESFEAQDNRTGQTRYKIIQLEAYIPAHPASFEEDYDLVQNMAIQNRQEAVFEEWIKKKQASALIRIAPEYSNCSFKRSGWVK